MLDGIMSTLINQASCFKRMTFEETRSRLRGLRIVCCHLSFTSRSNIFLMTGMGCLSHLEGYCKYFGLLLLYLVNRSLLFGKMDDKENIRHISQVPYASISLN